MAGRRGDPALSVPLPGHGVRCVNADTRQHAGRPAPYPGPRCYSCHHDKRRERKATARARKVETKYGLDAETYAALLAFQGGKCAICRTRRAVAVDHDHRQARLDGHSHDTGCPKCVRGLLCMVCNDVLAHFRDDMSQFMRGASYLYQPPLKVMSERLATRWDPDPRELM